MKKTRKYLAPLFSVLITLIVLWFVGNWLLRDSDIDRVIQILKDITTVSLLVLVISAIFNVWVFQYPYLVTTESLKYWQAFQPGEDIPELPDYVPSKETASANPALAKKYPLNILAPKSHGFINSSYANIENKLKAQGEQFVMIHPLDAEERGIKNGDRAKVFNDRGFFEAVSKITTDVNKGIVVTTLGYWRQLNNGVVNSVSSNAFGDMGNSPTSHDCLVEVQLA